MSEGEVLFKPEEELLREFLASVSVTGPSLRLLLLDMERNIEAQEKLISTLKTLDSLNPSPGGAVRQELARELERLRGRFEECRTQVLSAYHRFRDDKILALLLTLQR